MIKVLVLATLLLPAASLGQFESDYACFLSVMLRSLASNPAATYPDSYFDSLKALASGELKPVEVISKNLKISQDFNTMMRNFESLPGEFKNEILACPLGALANTKKRCEEKHNPERCQSNGPVSFAPSCPEGFARYLTFLCYKACPPGFKDLGFACEKPTAVVQKIFSSLDECMAEQKACVSIKQTLFLEPCPELSKRTLSNICVFSCPDGMIDNGSHCLKRQKVPAKAPVVLSTEDFLF